ncbi:epidermal growth factor receptor kinase substrate 8-like protein 2 isoform X2 [Tachypleus tridentatus]|uniref:epidermal growth factor receptor kinase substrate 8-like protein 2 isoform X2 n=1 Tax=Tachypleus tridentatus TaxID=6853 RepID=UPI003FD15FFC
MSFWRKKSKSQFSDVSSVSRTREFERPCNGQEMSPHHQDPDRRDMRSSYANGYGSDHNMADGPLYLLEHLATFSVGQKFGVESSRDGLRKLLQMEKTNGIWTQKMYLKLDQRWIIIMDYENGDVVEKFPMNLIRDPTCFVSNNPRDLYNNVLVFSVRENLKKNSKLYGEMHIFQCTQVSAQDVVDDIKLFMDGKWKPETSSQPVPSPPSVRAPEPPPSVHAPEPPPSEKVRDYISHFNAAAENVMPQVISGSQERQEQMRSSFQHYYDTTEKPNSVRSERYEKEVMMLNCCFDDIELFVGRIQHAAAAYQELERRRKRRKNKNKDFGDGMLSMRAKPPTEREFFEVLQKFKFSFNLLAKLKNHIHDPSAPELTLFLFTPLKIVVEAVHQTWSNLPPQVVTPLMTAGAVNLLDSCCSPNERDIWYSLGESWVIPRDKWRGPQGTYHPVFSNGWAPDYPFSEDRERAELTAAAAASAAQRFRRDNLRRAQEEADLRNEEYQRFSNFQPQRDSHNGNGYYDRVDTSEQHSTSYNNTPPGDIPRRVPYMEKSGANTPYEQDFRDARSDVRTGSTEHQPLGQFQQQQQPWFDDIRAHGNRCIVVVHSRNASNDKELSIVKGELLELLDDSRKWWKTRNVNGQIGYVPSTIVTHYQGPPPDEETFNNPPYSHPGPSQNSYYNSNGSLPVQGRRDYGGSDLSSYRGPQQHPLPGDWIQNEMMGKKGQQDRGLPSPQWPSVSPPQPEPMAAPIPPPPPPPPQATNPDTPKCSILKKKEQILPKVQNAQDLFQEELRERVTLGHKAKKKWGIIQQSNLAAVYITAESTPGEVQEWLAAKVFSPEVRQLFRDMTGKMLFKLTRGRLEEVLGLEVGSRLHSHITVQKNMSGYKTVSGEELKSILAERRKKVEAPKQRQLSSAPSVAPSSSSDEDGSSQEPVKSFENKRKQLMSDVVSDSD